MTRLAALSCSLVFSLAACTDVSEIPAGDPRKGAVRNPFGVAWPQEALIDAGGVAHWAQEAIADYQPIDQRIFPARVEMLDTGPCHLPKPAAGAIVRHVIVERGAGAAPLYQMSDAELVARSSADHENDDVLRPLNVVVTEQSTPVHLVLTSETSVLWNIMPAPGATIAGVTLVSGDGAGLANLPVGVPVAAIYGEALERCGVHPARLPTPDWPAVQTVKKTGAAALKATLAEKTAHGEAYAAFIDKRLGADASAGAIAQRGLGAALIGPMPKGASARAPMRTLKSATVLVSRSDRLIIGARRDYERELGGLIAAARGNDAGPRS